MFLLMIYLWKRGKKVLILAITNFDLFWNIRFYMIPLFRTPLCVAVLSVHFDLHISFMFFFIALSLEGKCIMRVSMRADTFAVSRGKLELHRPMGSAWARRPHGGEKAPTNGRRSRRVQWWIVATESSLQFRNASSVVGKLVRGGLRTDRFFCQFPCFSDTVRVTHVR